jgi:hypothetical protein
VHRRQREPSSRLRLKPETLARGGELLDEPEHIGRTAARERSHRIEQRLGIDPDHLADRLQHLLGAHTLVAAHFGMCEEP